MRHAPTPLRSTWRALLLLSLSIAGWGVSPSGGLRAQSLFAPVASGDQPAVASSVRLNDQVEVRIVDGALQANVRGDLSEVPTTEPGGCGAVAALVKELSGRVVVAAARGLFVLDAEHLIIDRMDVEVGLPADALLGVAADQRNRVWGCTAEDLFVVDARFGYHRTFARQDLPAGPFTGLHASADRVWLQTANGWYAYRPDQGEPPRTAAGEVLESSVTADPLGRIEVDIDAIGSGGVTLRHRRYHHHRLYPVVDDYVDGLRPGEHVVEVLGLDRDLRLRLLARYQVHVPLPARYSVFWLPVMAALGCVALLALAWPRRGRRRVHRGVLRAGVAAVLCLQLLAAMLGYGRSWPFVGFSMYTENYYAGSVLYKPLLRGIMANGKVRDVDFWSAGMVQDDSWQMLSELAHGPTSRLQQRVKIMNRRRKQRGEGGPDFVGIEIVDMRTRLTADGPFMVAPTVVRRWTQP